MSNTPKLDGSSTPITDLLAERDRINAELEKRLDQSNATLGKNVLRLRHARDWTQQELGDRINLVRSSVANIEAGRQSPPWAVLCLLADVFGVSLDAFREDQG